MCGFQSEVRGRGERADSPLSLCRIPKARRISGSSQRYLRKAPGNIAESAVLAYPRFPCGGQSITVFITRPDDPRQLRSFVWEERGKRAGCVRTKRADNVEVPKLLRTFAMIETYGN